MSIVRILPLSAALKALAGARLQGLGKAPDRLVACPVQVRAWAGECGRMSIDPHLAGMEPVVRFKLMDVEVVEGPADQQPELQWVQMVVG